MEYQALASTGSEEKLRELIAEKNKFLGRLTTRIEKLKRELLSIKQSYEAEIGKLYFELDQLDFAIFEMRKLKDLVERGFSQAEAEKILRDKEADARWKRESRTKEKSPRRGEVGDQISLAENKEELKRLWRKLAYRFHPDRKGGSEEIMKQINKAYSQGDLEGLRLIDEERFSEISLDKESHDLDYLSQKLKELEKVISHLTQKYKAFKKSEWFLWRTKLSKIEKGKGNLFKDVAKKLQATIIQRKRELARLKNSVVK